MFVTVWFVLVVTECLLLITMIQLRNTREDLIVAIRMFEQRFAGLSREVNRNFAEVARHENGLEKFITTHVAEEHPWARTTEATYSEPHFLDDSN